MHAHPSVVCHPQQVGTAGQRRDRDRAAVGGFPRGDTSAGAVEQGIRKGGSGGDTVGHEQPVGSGVGIDPHLILQVVGQPEAGGAGTNCGSGRAFVGVVFPGHRVGAVAARHVNPGPAVVQVAVIVDPETDIAVYVEWERGRGPEAIDRTINETEPVAPRADGKTRGEGGRRIPCGGTGRIHVRRRSIGDIIGDAAGIGRDVEFLDAVSVEIQSGGGTIGDVGVDDAGAGKARRKRQDKEKKWY